MTCIAALTDGKKVYMAGDSEGVAGYDISIRRDEKVFKIGKKMVLGFTSSFRMGQLLRFNLKPPKHPLGMDSYEYVVTKLIDVVRKTLKDGGFSTTVNGEETGGCFLLGYRGRLFRIDEDYQVGESLCGYDSVGCGESYSLGYLHGTKNRKNKKKIVIDSVKCAEFFSAGVSSPITYCEL